MTNPTATPKPEGSEELREAIKYLEMMDGYCDGGTLHSAELALKHIRNCVAALTVSTARIEEMTWERDEADRRAGNAERKLADLEDSRFRITLWLSEAKAARGYHDNVSFDVVWSETCAKADRADAVERQLAEANARIAELTNLREAEDRQSRKRTVELIGWRERALRAEALAAPGQRVKEG